MIHLRNFGIPDPLLLALLLALIGCGPRVKLVNVVPATHSDESSSDSEPNIAVDPADPSRIVISAFTPCPWTMATESPIYFSMNGGERWYLNCILPGNDTKTGKHDIDITARFAGSSGVLYAGILRGDFHFEMNILRTSDFTSGNPMKVLEHRKQEDQPYLQADAHSGDHVYVGNNDLSQCDLAFCTGQKSGKTDSSSLDSSPDAVTAPFLNQVLDDRDTCGADVLPVRPAIHHSGVIYVAYLRTDPGFPCLGNNLTNTADVVVVRDDNWGTAGYQDLKDTDRKRGVRVEADLYMSWLGALGNQRVGIQLSIAVDPKDRKKVYVAWGDGANPGDFILHVRQSSDSGQTWSASDLKTILRATNPALAINDAGQVGFLYQQLVTPGTCKGGAGEGCWETHFERLKDGRWRDLPHPLANVPDNAGAFPLGDYIHVMAVGDRFYGVFSANNYPDKDNFYSGVKYQRYVDWRMHQLFGDAKHHMVVKPSVDPYFFTVDE